MGWLFEDHAEAGARLAQELRAHRGRALGMAVGLAGVPVAAAVARRLGLPLGLVPVVSLRGPDGETFGALAPGGAAVVEWTRLERVGEEAARSSVAREQLELNRLEKAFAEFTRLQVGLRNVILISDGMETGMMTRAALRSVRRHHPALVVAAAPVVSEAAARELREDACECVPVACCESCVRPDGWYRDTRTWSESEILGMLDALWREGLAGAAIVGTREKSRIG